MPVPEKSVGERFAEEMAKPECPCPLCVTRRLLQAGHIAIATGAIVTVARRDPPEQPKPSPTLLQRVKAWLARRRKP